MSYLDEIFGSISSGIGSIFSPSTPATPGTPAAPSAGFPWGDLLSAGATTFGTYATNQGKIEADRANVELQNQGALEQIAARNAGDLEIAALRATLDQTAQTHLEATRLQIAAQKEIENRKRVAEAYRVAIENDQASGRNMGQAYASNAGIFRGFSNQ